MKTKVTPLQRISGIFLGITVILLIFTAAVTGVFKNKYFYISQNERYGITEKTQLKNDDEYAILYKNLISVFSGKKAENDTVLLSDENRKSAMIYSNGEMDMLNEISSTLAKVNFAYVLLVPSIALAIYTVVKQKRISLKGIGIYVVIFGVVGVIAVNVLTYTASPQALASYFTAPDKGFFLKNLFTENFFADFLTGIRRFYDFLTLIPLGMGYFLIKFSKKKNYTPDGEYMYQ